MLEIPPGTLAFGTQLPIQTQTTLLAGPWEADTTPADLMAIARAADRSGFHNIAVCDHVAIPRDKADAMSLWWQDTFTTLGWLAAGTERVALHDPRLRARLPPPAGGGQGLRHPRPPLGRPGDRRHRGRPRRGRVRRARRVVRRPGPHHRREAPRAGRGARAHLRRRDGRAPPPRAVAPPPDLDRRLGRSGGAAGGPVGRLAPPGPGHARGHRHHPPHPRRGRHRRPTRSPSATWSARGCTSARPPTRCAPPRASAPPSSSPSRSGPSSPPASTRCRSASTRRRATAYAEQVEAFGTQVGPLLQP